MALTSCSSFTRAGACPPILQKRPRRDSASRVLAPGSASHPFAAAPLKIILRPLTRLRKDEKTPVKERKLQFGRRTSNPAGLLDKDWLDIFPPNELIWVDIPPPNPRTRWSNAMSKRNLAALPSVQTILRFLILFFILATALFAVEVPSKSAQKKRAKSLLAYVYDDRISVVRARPEVEGPFLRRLRVGHRVFLVAGIVPPEKANSAGW